MKCLFFEKIGILCFRVTPHMNKKSEILVKSCYNLILFRASQFVNINHWLLEIFLCLSLSYYVEIEMSHPSILETKWYKSASMKWRLKLG